MALPAHHTDRPACRPQNQLLSRYLDTVGDGSGVDNANGNYSDAGVGLTDFFIQPSAGEMYVLGRLIIRIEDTFQFNAAEYGNLGVALTNGVDILIDYNGTEVSLVDEAPIKTNAAWGGLCYDVDIKDWGSGAGDQTLVARYTFTNAGQAVRLSPDDKLIVRLNDDFQGLIHHHFFAQGYIDSKLP